MIVIVIAKIAETSFEARIRNGTGPGSGIIQNTPVCYGSTEEEVRREAVRHISPDTVAMYGGARIEVREDQMTG